MVISFCKSQGTMLPFPPGSQPFTPSTFIPLYIPITGQHKKKVDCAFGLTPEARTQIQKSDLIAWLHVLPQDYEAEVSPCDWSSHKYSHLLHIFRVRNGARLGLFRVRYNLNLSSISIQMDDDVGPTQLCDPTATRVWVGGATYGIRCDFSMDGPAQRRPKHPMHVFNASLQFPRDPRQSALLPGVVRLLLDEEMARQYADVAGGGPKRNQFSEMLARITCGSVKTWLTETKLSDKMEAVDGEYLFGLTCVLPYAVDLLKKGPKCVMTDTTFEAVAPYTLAILHAIFANESIPIGFAIWPSETGNSYSQLYKHILELLGARAYLLRPAQPTHPPAPLAPEQAEQEWVEDAPREDEDLDELPDPTATAEDNAGAAGDSVQVVDLDLACEEEQWEAPSGAEVFLGSDGAEHSENYEILRSNTEPDVWQWHDLLLGLPIVTDQGRALEHFVLEFGLIWKLCHRHILENIGAKSRVGRWAARLLRCFSAAEYRRTCCVINEEMRLAQINYADRNYPADHADRTLMRLLGVLHDTRPVSDMRRWALWLRLGCPRTTNSAESVNGHLNAEIVEGQRFVDRVFSVARHFTRRYYSRDQWHNRALNRNRDKCFPADPTDPSYSEAKVLFYQHLHDAVDRDFEDRMSDLFPAEGRALFFAAESWRLRAHPDWRLPHNWEVVGSIRKTRLPGQVDGDGAPTVLPLHEKSAHTLRARVAWRIACDLRMEMGVPQWKKHGAEIYAGIIAIAATLGISEHRVGALAEGQWRAHCVVALPTWQSSPKPAPARKTPCAKPRNQSPLDYPGPLPLFNLRNTCFMNATLQLFFAVPPLRSHLADLAGTGPRPLSLSLACRALVTCRDRTRAAKSFDVRSGLQAFLDQVPNPVGENFRDGNQHDMDEFIQAVLNRLDFELDPKPIPEPPEDLTRSSDRASWLKKQPTEGVLAGLFRGFSRTTIVPRDCPHVIEYATPFWVISAPIPEGTPKIEDCIRSFLVVPPLDKANGFRCHSCGRDEEIDSTTVISPGPFLIVQLVRFTNAITKNHTPVSFGPQLDITPDMQGPNASLVRYALIALAEHKGVDIQGGHYLSYVRFGKVWFCCNDDSVTWGCPKCEKNTCVYFLLYQRADTQ
jgi:ubiquitin C-terminal hydrolase